MVADSLNNFGYINHSGVWVLKPIYDRATNFKNGIAEVHVRAMNFNDQWHISPGQKCWDRKQAFKIFLAQHNIFELDRKTIEKILGQPDGAAIKSKTAAYRLLQGGCLGGISIVLNYENDRVISYTIGGGRPYDVQHPYSGD